jgi:hypothetical protein
MPDVRIDAQDVSFTPSMPRVGDTVNVRFRLTNAGDADVVGVPVSLSVDARIVATDTFDVPRGRTVLAGLEWNSAEGNRRTGAVRSGRRSAMNSAGEKALLLVDPAGTVRQKTTLEKSAALPHFSLGQSTVVAGGSLGRQRAMLEVVEGGCVGLRLLSGATTSCGTGDLEVSVSDLASATYTMAAPEGIATLGVSALDPAPAAGLNYAPEVAAMAGHTYAVRLRSGEVVLLTVEVIRNPRQLGARTARVFGTGGRRATPGMGGTGAVETGDTAGVSGGEGAVQFRISYTSP